MPELMVICHSNALGEILLVPIAENEGGWGLSIDRIQRLAQDVDSAQVGSALRLALESCDISLYDRAVRFPEVVAAREKTVGAFQRKWKAITVMFSADSVTIRPSRRCKGRQACYEYLREKQMLLPSSASDEVLGDAVRGAFEVCIEGN